MMMKIAMYDKEVLVLVDGLYAELKTGCAKSGAREKKEPNFASPKKPRSSVSHRKDKRTRRS